MGLFFRKDTKEDSIAYQKGLTFTCFFYMFALLIYSFYLLLNEKDFGVPLIIYASGLVVLYISTFLFKRKSRQT